MIRRTSITDFRGAESDSEGEEEELPSLADQIAERAISRLSEKDGMTSGGGSGSATYGGARDDAHPDDEEDEDEEDVVGKEWVRDPSPKTQHRWRNTETGEHRYQRDKPDPNEGDEEESDDAGYEEQEPMDLDGDSTEVSEVESEVAEKMEEMDDGEAVASIKSMVNEKTGIDFEREDGRMTVEQAKSVGSCVECLSRSDQERMSELGEFLEGGIRTVEKPDAGYVAVFKPEDGRLDINLSEFSEPEEIPDGTMVARDETFLSDVLIHEFGHAFHRKEVEDNDVDPRDVGGSSVPVDDIVSAHLRRKISHVSSLTAPEFVAEVFLMKSLGMDIPERKLDHQTDFEEAYEKLHGPDPIEVEK